MLTIDDFFSAAADAGLTDAATWTPAGGSPTDIDVFRDSQFAIAAGMESARPSIRVPTERVPGIKQGDAITLSIGSYLVAEVHPDTPQPDEVLIFLRKAA